MTAAAVSVAVAPSIGAAKSKPAGAQVSLLYSLTGDAGSMRLLPGSGNRYAFTLKGADERTVWFSNRPARHSGTLPTTGLVAQWAGLGFAADPPNVAITLHEPSGATDTIVAVMRKPTISTSGTLGATLEVLSIEKAQALTGNLALHGNAHDATIPSSLGSVSIFIDDVTGTFINGCLIQPYTACPGMNLGGADLTGANLKLSMLSGITLAGADLSYANLISTDLTRANLTRAILEHADLRWANLTGANLNGANFYAANLSSAVWVDGRRCGSDVNWTGKCLP